MHIAFIPYGKRSEVELLFRDMEAQKHKLPLHKGKKKATIWIQSQVRQLPLGIYEYICPKEDLDCVLNTLKFKRDRYTLGKLKLTFLRKIIKYKDAPEYKENLHYNWIIENVNIIPLGIKEDAMDGKCNFKGFEGWTHEAI